MSTISRPGGGLAGALATMLAIVTVLAGCSSAAAQDPGVATLTDPSVSPDPSASPSLDPEEAMEAFAKCMRDHGIDIQVAKEGGPGTTSSGSSGGERKPVNVTGTDQDKSRFEQANKDCAPLLPQGGVNGGPAQMDPEMQDKLIAFSRCMREHGIDFPDPVFSNGGATVQIGGPGEDGPKIDPESEEFQAAQEACQDLLPGKPTTNSTGGDSEVLQ